jgi:hypothetical protein
MRDLRGKIEPALRIVCYLLAGLVLYELLGVGVRWNPFRSVIVPDLPALTMATNAPGEIPNGINPMAAKSATGTNGVVHPSGTNSPLMATSHTNPVSTATAATNRTNTPAGSEANAATNGAVGLSNGAAPHVVAARTNTANTVATNEVLLAHVTSAGTHVMGATGSANGGTNFLLAIAANGTNVGLGSTNKMKNAGNRPEIAGVNGPGGLPGMPPGFGRPGMPGKPVADLPPGVQTRIGKITESEILGPVMHPLPMALLGIAGNFAFLRTDSGQTGLEKEGDALGDLKLLRIGINRVLIEQNGQKKELTIFNGYGGESLLTNDSTNENKHL